MKEKVQKCEKIATGVRQREEYYETVAPPLNRIILYRHRYSTCCTYYIQYNYPLLNQLAQVVTTSWMATP
jgi:hypothetical protein